MSQPIALGTISEDFDESDCMFTEVDERCYLYASNDFIPCSASSPITWQDLDLESPEDVPDIIDKGDMVITRELAELIMSFDPYGVEVYPARLQIEDETLSDRYILSVKNIIEVVDDQRSRIIKNPKPHRPDIVSRLAISAKKLKQLPLSHRLIFRVNRANSLFFDSSIVNKYIEGLQAERYYLCQAVPFDTSEMAPIR